ncbi:hypothetical protein CBL_00231 [Carabus blaptoides fortunei]
MVKKLLVKDKKYIAKNVTSKMNVYVGGFEHCYCFVTYATVVSITLNTKQTVHGCNKTRYRCLRSTGKVSGLYTCVIPVTSRNSASYRDGCLRRCRVRVSLSSLILGGVHLVNVTQERNGVENREGDRRRSLRLVYAIVVSSPSTRPPPLALHSVYVRADAARIHGPVFVDTSSCDCLQKVAHWCQGDGVPGRRDADRDGHETPRRHHALDKC